MDYKSAFQSDVLPGKMENRFSNTHSQTSLIKCLLKQSHAPEIRTSSLKLFNRWLNFQNENSTYYSGVITRRDIAFIIKEILKYFENYERVDNDGQTILLNTVQSILKNSIFQQYFCHHPETYCDIIATNLIRKQDSKNVLNLLKLSNGFFKRIVLQNDFRSYFMKTVFGPLVTTSATFAKDTDIFMESAYLLQNCLIRNVEFPTNSEDIEVINEFLTVFHEIGIYYNKKKLDLSKFSYRLLFQCVCNLYSSNFKQIYSVFIFLMNSLSFNLARTFNVKNSSRLLDVYLSFSLAVLKDVINILANRVCVLDCTINQISFSDFLKDVLTAVINLVPTSNLHVYSIIESIISINPLIIEQLIAEVLTYLIINEHSTSEIQENYEKLMVAIFQVFSKLHRIEKLVSIIIRSLKNKLENNCKEDKIYYEFLGINDLVEETQIVLPEIEIVLSDVVLQAFSANMMNLLSWQVINIFKTLNFHFAETLETIHEDEKFYFYVELLSGLFCCFLSSMRVAEHVASSNVQEKLHKTMEDLKLTLSKFGELLLNKEHNHVLMRAYLNICFTYGEVCIILGYYCTELNTIVAKVEDLDYSLCNLVYLHNYLSREQWCIIAQRVANFGEIECKHIMQKLYLQKLKAMHTFKATYYTETKLSFIKDDTLEAEDSWKALLQEPFFLNHILPEMNHQTILSAANFVFKKYCFHSNDLAQNQILIDCDILMRSVLYCTLHKICKLFKCKQKFVEKSRIVLTKELFSIIDVDLFIHGYEIKEVHEKFVENLECDWNIRINKIDAVKLDIYLGLIRQLPILHMPATIQDIVLVFVITVLHDCKHDIQNQSVKEHLEIIGTGLLTYRPDVLPKILSYEVIFSKIIPLFDKWKDIFIICLQWTTKNIHALQKLQNGVDYILTLDKENFLQHATIFLNVINKQIKKARLCQESKKLLTQYKLQICEKIVLLLDNVNVHEKLEAFALTLKFYLAQNKQKSLSKIEEMLIYYVDYAVTNLGNDSLLLLVTVLHNTSQLKIIEEKLPLKIWQKCKHLMVTDVSDSKNHLQLYMLIFTLVNDEEFALIVEELFQITKKALQNKEFGRYLYYMEIWGSILTCSFKSTKMKLWQSALDKFLREQHEYLSKNSDAIPLLKEETGKFQRKIIQVVQLPLTVIMIDTILLMPSTLLSNEKQNFSSLFALSVSIMEFFLKHRNSFIMDRLPAYLHQYRCLLQQLCVHGNSDLNLTINEVQIIADCAYMLEKLTNMLIQNRKHLLRVAPYLMADFLNVFEKFSLYSNIKVHLNNCFYSLLSLCDQHGVSFLMRVLSTASTEMFKIMFEQYKKHYRFTGKV